MTKTASYRYLPNGLMSTMTTLEGLTVTYGYDAALRLITQTDPHDPNTDKTVRYTLDARNRRTAITFPSGVKQSVMFSQGRVATINLTNAAGVSLQSFGYTYFAGGNVRQVNEKTPGHNLLDSVIAYTYDEQNRLATAVRTGQNPYNHGYGYDHNNNRTGFTRSGVLTTAEYDAANQLTRQGTTYYAYDRAGNLDNYGPTANRTESDLGYDASNKWTGGHIGSTTVAFGYDGFGRRVERQTGTGAQTNYWYDQTGMSLETGGTNSSYLRDPGGRLLSRWFAPVHANYGTDR